MARTQSVRTERHVTNSHPTQSVRCRGRLGAGFGLAILLMWSTCGLAASGPGIGFKVGVQTLESPINLEDTTRTRFEFELSSARFFDDHFDLAFTAGRLLAGFLHHRICRRDRWRVHRRRPTSTTSASSISAWPRFYPLGDASEIRPYVGAGVGYFWFFDRWDYDYAETFEVPLFPGVLRHLCRGREASIPRPKDSSPSSPRA